jgi:acetylornithine deacetylase
MGRVLGRLEAYGTSLRGSPPHPLLGPPSFSAGVIEGGEAVNIVPGRCTLEVDRRTLPGETAAQVLGEAAGVLGGLGGWSFDPPHLSVPGMEVSVESPAVRFLSLALRDVCGETQVEAAQYATDAGVYNGAGIPAVVFGPGDIAQAHTAEEWIDIENLHAAAAVIRRLIQH